MTNHWRLEMVYTLPTILTPMTCTPPGSRFRSSISLVVITMALTTGVDDVFLGARGNTQLFARQTQGARPAPAGLKIVVIEGEDAVNVIQQKTAVAPVVEVRDGNDQPVAGAVVRFAIRGGRATFGGARTLAVTTNAAGRAVAAGLTPTGSGAVQITAAASFQGQTAVATIAQTNVLTAAQAAAGSTAAGGTAGAGGAAGAGTVGAAAAGGAGAGGGVSAATLGIVGGAIGGGALIATQVLDLGGSDGGGGNGTAYSGPFSGILTTFAGACTFDQQQTGTINMSLTVSDSGSVTGNAELDGTQTIVKLSPQCAGLFLNSTEKYGCCTPTPQVTGSTQSLTFSASHPGNIGSNWTYAFSGALSGSQVTGVFTLTVQAPGFHGTADFPVTLTKQ